MTLPRFPISLPGGQVALAVRAIPGADLGRALRGMGLTTGVPALAVVGTGTRQPATARLGPLMEKVVVPVAAAAGATVVDDGNSRGVPALLGDVRRRAKATFPLLGVVPESAIGGDGLDPSHSHFVVVAPPASEGPAWWLAEVLTAVAAGNRSVVLVVSGRDAAWDAVAACVRARHLVMAVSRTGGVADHLAAAVAGRPADDRAATLAASGQVRAVDPAPGASHVADVLRAALSRPDTIEPATPPP